MALLTNEIYDVLFNNGTVKFSGVPFSTPPASPTLGQGSGHVSEVFFRHNLTAGNGVITLDRVANNADNYNCVNVLTTNGAARIGRVGVPGYVYTDSFSGCVFYLYKDGTNKVTGVHAHNGLEEVTTKTGWWIFSKKMVNTVVREYSPQSYMTSLNKKMLCRHATRKILTTQEKMQMCFLAFLSCVEVNKATTFLYCYKDGQDGRKVRRIVEIFEDFF